MVFVQILRYVQTAIIGRAQCAQRRFRQGLPHDLVCLLGPLATRLYHQIRITDMFEQGRNGHNHNFVGRLFNADLHYRASLQFHFYH